ncbi:MAG: RnfABCDGE type electron transport complex subunit D [Candidatus Marinimicrobia bacterium]|nr:RnfABCDGE type electron transport complex subunit D [Candidatus Neomarinimicrobiota bacterium]
MTEKKNDIKEKQDPAKTEASAEKQEKKGTSAEKPKAKPKPKKNPRAKLFKSERMTIVAPAPHAKGKQSVPRIMYTVIIALLPAVAASIFFFGTRAMVTIMVAVFSAMVAEFACNKIMKTGVTIDDGSAILTGLLLAMTLPPTFPVAATALGAVIAIVFGKQVFGGLGANIFNPALIGRAFLQASFPVKITTWTLPAFASSNAYFDIATSKTVDTVSGATPLGLWKFEGIGTHLKPLLFGNIGGCIGETSALALLLGGIVLLILKYADWRIPLSYIGTVFLFSGALWLIDPSRYPDPLFMILSGGLILGAFFMATDMVTSPVTPLGTWIYGIGMGVMLVVIRIWGGLPEGVMYSILFMNGLVPLLNRWTRPKYFGEIQEESQKK